ncbi:GNAT family N-acetyltransferase [Pseudosporangium ferrugineum]|uniref:Acetyltransferase (GNAT) family protein n=1 Tax=Pseudosporangium ferrugineum TaxID=439699 RepID=A0A2T0RC70_9ACTN|nr:GNAT family N-acetyltransferase [Pseudosporangium ferrugineum]PRY18776.1 acetyltransferase (GNAT) family protein [Pseudosporangium ferrugineum]
MLEIRQLPVGDPDAVAIVRSYLTEIVDRYHGRPMPATLVDRVLAEEPPGGVAVLLVAYRDGKPVGCVGLRLPGEVTKMYVRPEARRTGVARHLLAAVEDAARARGLRTLRLDTRNDLVEARALYAACGYREVPAREQRQFADHWFEKAI